ncbi:hypothetical protein [Leisingera daeponensis]|uniref:hypothetical protein n=1 Tax=Leisingera daeponensis TaxID=405746 RepID=UPI001C981230|nr:hypothetical protein [Leisingera daeponensis]MBY6055407.1 hypothetical protein [Leisingera daeponensis]
MDEDFAVGFRKRFEAAYEASAYTSHRQLSIDVGWSEARASRIVGGHFDNSRDGPGFFGIVRACEKLGITPDYLAGISKWREPGEAAQLNALTFLQAMEQMHKAPDVEAMSRAYMRSGARLEGFDEFRDYFDLYEAPDMEAGVVKAVHVGAKSLSAMRMGVANHIVLQEAYDRAPAEFQKRIFEAQKRACEAGMTIELDSIDERMANRPVHVKIDYLRVAMKVTDANEKPHVLIYCQLIPQ